MPALNPQRIPVVAVAAMNQVHHDEAALINALAQSLEDCAAGACTPEAVDLSLSRLLEHMQAHFDGEEARMRTAGFPPYPVHKAEHERMLAQATEVALRWRQHRTVGELQEFVERQLPAWMLQHIATMDAVTAQFLLGRARAAAPG